LRNDEIMKTTTVYGEVPKTKPQPPAGNGIAFYHSRRAKFARRNPYGKRLSTRPDGEIAKLDPNRPFESWDYPIETRFERRPVPSTIREPLARSDETLDVLDDTEIAEGWVNTWSYAPPAVWSKMLQRVDRNSR
jgi:hypothetical protein